MPARSITAASFATAVLLVNAGAMCAVAHADCVSKLNGAAQACTPGVIENLTNDKMIRLIPMDSSPPPKSLSKGPTPGGWAVQELDNDGGTLLVPPHGSAQIFGLTHLELDTQATREQSAATSLCNASGLCKYLDPTADLRACLTGMAAEAAAEDNGAQITPATLWADVQTAKACKKVVDAMNEKNQEATAEAASEADRKALAEEEAKIDMEKIADSFKSNLNNAIKLTDKFDVLEEVGVDLAQR
jgi:hypothetical protein